MGPSAAAAIIYCFKTAVATAYPMKLRSITHPDIITASRRARSVFEIHVRARAIWVQRSGANKVIRIVESHPSVFVESRRETDRSTGERLCDFSRGTESATCARSSPVFSKFDRDYISSRRSRVLSRFWKQPEASFAADQVLQNVSSE